MTGEASKGLQIIMAQLVLWKSSGPFLLLWCFKIITQEGCGHINSRLIVTSCFWFHRAPFDALVIKANGLAAGKGVVVAGTKEEACNDVRAFLDGHRFGSAGSTIVVEEKLVGPEVSILCFTDGKDVFPMPAAQDAKRVGEGDSGSNTGGMGAYAPVHPSILSEEIFDEIIEYVRIVVKLMAEEGRPYKGILYAGVMLTEGGPRFLEFNCRFGDPETEVVAKNKVCSIFD